MRQKRKKQTKRSIWFWFALSMVAAFVIYISGYTFHLFNHTVKTISNIQEDID